MDTRRRHEPRERASTPELGTETVPVELVELTNVQPPGRGIWARAMVAVGAIAVAMLVLVIANGRLTNPMPSPSVPAVALVSGSPVLTPFATPTPGPTPFRPSAAPATLTPTKPPPWQWAQSAFLPEMNPSVEGVWALNGTVVTLIRHPDANDDRDLWSIARLAEADSWELFPAPSAIAHFFAGTVVDGRLWFLAEVGGVTDAETTWELASTADGVTWQSLGTAEGLPPLDGASVLARTSDSWVLVTERDEGVGAAHARISWSTDGRHWQPADLPTLRSNVGYTRAASIEGATVLLGFEFDTLENTQWFVLRSTDGRTWRRSGFASPSSRSPQDLECDDRICVITLEPSGLISSARQALMESADGGAWAEVDVNVPWSSPDSTIRLVTPTATGFIALTGSPEHAVLSADGVSWRAVDVLPPDARDYISWLAVGDHSIVAVVPSQSSGEPNRVWLGSLAAMGT